MMTLDFCLDGSWWQVMVTLVMFCVGTYIGHALSPWVDGKILAWKTRKSDDGMTDEDFRQ